MPTRDRWVETFVVSELLRSASWSEVQPFANHFRDTEQREVDLLLDSPDGRVVAVEVKTAVDADEGDFRWLSYLRDRMGKRFATEFDLLPELITGRSDYRVLVGTGFVVPAYVVVGQLAKDGSGSGVESTATARPGEGPAGSWGYRSP